MATITISVDDEVEKKFRKAAEAAYKQKKGRLGKAMTEAMKQWLHQQKQQEITKRQLKLLEKGFKLGEIKYRKREELHER